MDVLKTIPNVQKTPTQYLKVSEVVLEHFDLFVLVESLGLSDVTLDVLDLLDHGIIVPFLPAVGRENESLAETDIGGR